MSSTIFTGPLLAGNVLNSDGTGNLAGVGGSSGTQNVGFAEMVQFAPITQSTSSVATTIVIPANSLITSMYVNVTTAWSGGNLQIGVAGTATAFANAVTAPGVGQNSVTPTTATQVGVWNNVSSTQDQQVVVSSTAGTAGVGVLIVKYLQAANGYTNGQYAA